MNYTLFNVTHASIIDFDLSNKSNNLSSTSYETLRYQVINFRRFGWLFYCLYIIETNLTFLPLIIVVCCLSKLLLFF